MAHPDDSGPPPGSEAAKGAEPTDPSEDVRAFIGDDVRIPGDFPRDYRPSDSAREPMFRVELEEFAGPMDLLLYLIRHHDIDVRNIPIKLVTTRYLQVLEQLRALQIDVASEFLVLAAELTHIKSKMLLPAKEGVAIEDEDLGETEDPRAELVRRLLEYQKYRDAASQLDDRDVLGRDVFPRVPPGDDAAPEVDPGLRSVSVFRLVELMSRMMRTAPPTAHAISYEQYNISERIQFVMAFGEARTSRFGLGDLLTPIETRAELVVTFIAVLEMTKLGLVKLFVELTEAGEERQEGPEDDQLPVIILELTGKRFEGELVDDYGGG